MAPSPEIVIVSPSKYHSAPLSNSPLTAEGDSIVVSLSRTIVFVVSSSVFLYVITPSSVTVVRETVVSESPPTVIDLIPYSDPSPLSVVPRSRIRDCAPETS